MILNLSDSNHMNLIKKAYGQFTHRKNIYQYMYNFYKGKNKDSYTRIENRSNLKVDTNFIKKFIKEEVSYTVGNPITYDGELEIVKDIEYNTAHWSRLHDEDLMKYLLVFTKVYELYYINKNGDFSSKIVKPVDGYALVDSETDEVLFFIHRYQKELNTKDYYIDIYDDEKIYHFDGLFHQISSPTTHYFGEVPVAVGILSEEGEYDSLCYDIKGLQCAFETNLSDVSNEISDFRNSYLTFIGCKLQESELPKMKQLGVLNVPRDGKIDWLIKNINDSFIQNTLNTLEDKMYQIACHINHNEAMQSNVSGVALRSRLIALENKCKLEQQAHHNIVKVRLRFLFKYLKLLQNKDFDYRTVKVIYTPNIPQDDLSTAQMLSQTPDGIISRDTARGLFSFINNKALEKEKIDAEDSIYSEGSRLLDE